MILIIGGGLAGLSTAYHLGDIPHLVLEAEDRPGGLCRTTHVNGFAFDHAGHLLHLRDRRAGALVDELLPGRMRTVERRSYIRSQGATLPFPFQANLHGLPPDVVAECVLGFITAMEGEIPDDPGSSFEEWSRAVFGEGISRSFMLPYNEKLFRRSAGAMTADWVSWAVPRPSLEEVVRGAVGVENRGMGYNPTFSYPATGGIEALPEALAEHVSSIRCGARVAGVDLDARRVTLADGECLEYDRLVVTAPLPGFLRSVTGGGLDWAAQAERLDWSVVACLNLGVDEEGVGGGAHWIYFPDESVSFYRVGFPTNFSDGVAPRGASSMYVEFGLRRDEAIDAGRLEKIALEGLLQEEILTGKEKVLACEMLRLDPGYVIFDRERQEVMAKTAPALEKAGVHLTGRYGAWTYSYMERAILDGIELAEKLRS